MTHLISCPHCKRMLPYDEANPLRPFCSERCKQIDLGRWAAGDYAIKGTSSEVEESNPSTMDAEFPRVPSKFLH